MADITNKELQTAREAAGLYQYQVAHMMHVSEDVISRWERDEAYLARKLQRGVTYVSQRMMGRKPWPMDEAYKIMDMIRAPYDQLPVYFPPKGA